ncbi:MAG: ArsC family transcriptional regulator [Lacunisphaera sp.]|nr:ArsC family transcriptional regulator [Lacunisphaera sp.]MDB6166568.1 ArsC family transcriptional regulator [Lacunisphaera sp.]
MSGLTVYTLANCDTCRRAVQWLRARGLTFAERPIRETPPTLGELRRMLAAHDGNFRRLCNTAGRDYREMGLAEKLPAMSESEALKLLAANGNLVKRPFLLGPGLALIGFEEEVWREKLPEKL